MLRLLLLMTSLCLISQDSKNKANNPYGLNMNDISEIKSPSAFWATMNNQKTKQQVAADSIEEVLVFKKTSEEVLQQHAFGCSVCLKSIIAHFAPKIKNADDAYNAALKKNASAEQLEALKMRLDFLQVQEKQALGVAMSLSMSKNLCGSYADYNKDAKKGEKKIIENLEEYCHMMEKMNEKMLEASKESANEEEEQKIRKDAALKEAQKLIKS